MAETDVENFKGYGLLWEPGQEAGPGPYNHSTYTEFPRHWGFCHTWCWHSEASEKCIYLLLFPSSLWFPPSTWCKTWSFSKGGVWPCCQVDLSISLCLEIEHVSAVRKQQWCSGSEYVQGIQAAVLFVSFDKSETLHTKLIKQKGWLC